MQRNIERGYREHFSGEKYGRIQFQLGRLVPLYGHVNSLKCQLVIQIRQIIAEHMKFSVKLKI